MRDIGNEVGMKLEEMNIQDEDIYLLLQAFTGASVPMISAVLDSQFEQYTSEYNILSNDKTIKKAFDVSSMLDNSKELKHDVSAVQSRDSRE